MNALVAIRQNATGFMSPTSAERNTVAQKLASGYGLRKTNLSNAAAATQTKALSNDRPTDALESQELSRDAFLQLLVLQLQNQDPLDPVDNQEMLAQLAQFSSLEQMNNLNDRIDTLSGNVDQLNFISANQLLGRNVSGIGLDGQLHNGQVEGIQLDGSVVVLTVDGKPMSMAGVFQIDNEPVDGASGDGTGEGGIAGGSVLKGRR